MKRTETSRPSDHVGKLEREKRHECHPYAYLLDAHKSSQEIRERVKYTGSIEVVKREHSK